MPLPWKKAKISRISRLVTDLQPPNRGNSLVVETGFPTSLIDLFVKNRDKLKKSSKKKKRRQENQQGLFEEESVSSDPVSLSNSRDSEVSSGPVCVVDRFEKVENLQSQQERKSFGICNYMVRGDKKSCNVFSQTIVEECVNARIVAGNSGCGEIERSAFMAVLKMFLVVILALSTTKLAVGITVSAFVLIFLECIGKYVFCLLKPCSNARMILQPLFRRGCSLFYVRRNVLISEKESNCLDEKKVLVIHEECTSVTDHKFDSWDSVESRQSDCHSEEIQVEESIDMASIGVDGNRRMEREFDLLNREKRWGCLDAGSNARASDVRLEEVDESRKGGSVWGRETSRRAKIKTKIKKLVPKNLRTGKRKGKEEKERAERELDSEASSCLGETKHSIATAEQESCGKITIGKLLEDDNGSYYGILRKQELVHGTSNPMIPGTVSETVNDRRMKRELSRGSSFTSWVSDADSEKEQKQVLDSGICGTVCYSKSETKSAMATVVEERLEIERKGNAGYLIMFLIVLIGLAGGRVLAIVLTFASVFIIKFFGRHRKCVIKR